MWKCQICETLNEGNFCSVCGNPKPKAGAGSSDSPKSKNTSYGHGNYGGANNRMPDGNKAYNHESIRKPEHSRDIGVSTAANPGIYKNKEDAVLNKKRNKRNILSVLIAVVTLFLIALTFLSHWTYMDGSKATMWDVLFDIEACDRAMIMVTNVERICTALVIILCVCPCIVSFILLNAKQRNAAVATAVISFIFVTIYCSVIVVDTLQKSDLSGGLFPFAAPVSMLLLVIFVRMKMKTIQDIENHIYRPVMYGEDKKFD